VSTPGKPGAVRGKLFLNATSANIGAQFGYDPNDDASPKDRMISSMNDVGRGAEGKFSSDAKSDFKPQDRPGNGRQGAPQRGDKGADNHDLPGESYYDDGQYGGARINPAMPQSSMIRSPPTNKDPPAGAAAKDPPKGGFMAALKYFQDEPIPGGAQAKSDTSSAAPAAVSAAAMNGSMVRVDRPAARQTATAAAAAEVLKTETEVLNELVQQDEEAQNVAIKRVSCSTILLLTYFSLARKRRVGAPRKAARSLAVAFLHFNHNPLLTVFIFWASCISGNREAAVGAEAAVPRGHRHAHAGLQRAPQGAHGRAALLLLLFLFRQRGAGAVQRGRGQVQQRQSGRRGGQ
jgi:hypothetical protein